MALFVLDASVAISWCFPGDPAENTPYSQAVLSRLAEDDAIVPEIWAFEVANSIFVSHSKRRRINERQIQEYLDLLKALPIRVESQSMIENIDLESLARRWELTAYDAAYLHRGAAHKPSPGHLRRPSPGRGECRRRCYRRIGCGTHLAVSAYDFGAVLTGSINGWAIRLTTSRGSTAAQATGSAPVPPPLLPASYRASTTRSATAALRRADGCQSSPVLGPRDAAVRSVGGPLCWMPISPPAVRAGWIIPLPPF